jgi:eukaryotic-like serine/threonine-protein kinase
LNRAPVAPVRLNPDTPVELERIINKALEKDRELRFQTAAEIRADLKRLKRDTDSGRSAAVSTAVPVASVSASVPAAARESSSASTIIAAEAKRHKFGLGVTALVIFALIAAAAFGIYSLLKRPVSIPFQRASVEKITDSGNAALAAISPDGKYVVYTQQNSAGMQSLWIRHLPTKSNVQVIPVAKERFIGITFAPDGDYFYYIREDEVRGGIRNLYKAAVLGGTPRKLLEDIDSAVGFSHDGKRIVFRRDNPSVQETAIFVANVDGSDSRKVISKTRPAAINGSPAWSADDTHLAAFVYDPAKNNPGSTTLIDVETGAETHLKQELWTAGTIAWDPQDRGIYAVISDRSTNYDRQVAFISLPDGAIRRISNDLNSYTEESMSTTNDGKSLVAVAVDARAQLWMVSTDGSSRATTDARQITSGNEPIRAVVWMHDNKLLTTTRRNEIVIRDLDGQNSFNVNLSGSKVESVRECGTAGFLIMGRSTEKNALNTWRVDRDGGNLKQLTTGDDDLNAQCSADGKFFLYYGAEQGKSAIYRRNIEGGAPTLAVDVPTGRYTLSPDGNLVVAGFTTGTNVQDFRRRGAIFSLQTGKQLTEMPRPDLLPKIRKVVFTPDSKSMISAIRENGTDNLWISVPGREPKQLTFFNNMEIFDFDLSPDGKQAVLVRGQTETDVVLFTEQQ